MMRRRLAASACVIFALRTVAAVSAVLIGPTFRAQVPCVFLPLLEQILGNVARIDVLDAVLQGLHARPSPTQEVRALAAE